MRKNKVIRTVLAVLLLPYIIFSTLVQVQAGNLVHFLYKVDKLVQTLFDKYLPVKDV